MSRYSPISFSHKLKSDSPIPEFRSKSVLSTDVNSKIFKLNKALYNQKVPTNKISLLEKLVLRGGFVLHDKKTTQKTHKKTQSLIEKLNGDHLIVNDGKQILNLPKLPYGQHRNYEEERFSNKHFYAPDKVPPSRAKDVDEFNRKLRLLVKKSKTGIMRERIPNVGLNSSNKNYNIYDTGAGLLMCQKEAKIIKTYENEKNKWTTHLKLFQPFISKEQELQWKKKLKKRLENAKKIERNGKVYEEQSENEENNNQVILRHLLVLEAET